MNTYLTEFPQVVEILNLVEWLLLINVVLTGAVILLAFRASHYKHRVDELEAEIKTAIRTTIDAEIRDQPVKRR